MKKLGKLQVNPEKLMQNEELLTLKGGYDGGCNYYFCGCYGIPEAWWSCYCSGMGMYNDVSIRCGVLGGGCSYAGPCS